MSREIIIKPYNSEWKTDYIRTEQILKKVFGDLLVDVQHIGSTSIEGLSAKPTIDVLVIVKDITHVDELNKDMSKYGFIAKGEHGISGRRYFYKIQECNQFIDTHHIHVYQVNNPKYQEELLFRDYLRISEDARKEYEKLKTELALKFRKEPRLYTNAKSRFILNTVNKAKKYFS